MRTIACLICLLTLINACGNRELTPAEKLQKEQDSITAATDVIERYINSQMDLIRAGASAASAERSADEIFRKDKYSWGIIEKYKAQRREQAEARKQDSIKKMQEAKRADREQWIKDSLLFDSMKKAQ